MQKIKLWIRAVRAPFFTATIVPVLLGVAIAYNEGVKIDYFKFILTLIGMLFIHAGVNFTNDYYDYTSRNDDLNLTPTPFSGGSRVIQENLITPIKILIAALLCFFIGSIIGLYLNYLSGNNTILILGIIGVFLGFFYTASPLRIGYKKIGEIVAGLGFGPLVVMGSYYVQTNHLTLNTFLSSLPVAILISLVLFINEFPDYEADKKVGKKTLVVSLGKEKSIKLYYFLLLLNYLLIIFFIIFKFIPFSCIIVFLTAPLVIKAIKLSKENYEKIYEFLPVNATTILIHLTFGLLFSFGYIIDKII